MLRRKDLTTEKVKEILNNCVASLNDACKRLNVNTPPHLFVSTKPKNISDESRAARGWDLDGNVVKLINLTRTIVEEKLLGDAWILWAIAQRKSVREKINACVS